MLTATVQAVARVDARRMHNFDVLPTVLAGSYANRGTRPDLLFALPIFRLAGEARGRSQRPSATVLKSQRDWLNQLLPWSEYHESHPLVMTWAYLTKEGATVDLFVPEQTYPASTTRLANKTAKVAEDLGFDVELTRGSKDGGRDLLLRCRDVSGTTKCIFAEVKHWASGKRVGPRELQDLLTVVARDSADGGVLISTSGFTMPAKQLAATYELAELVRLIDLDEMVTYFRESATPSRRAAIPPTSLLAEFVRKPLVG
jgi:Restriction endonuclease